ASLGAAPVVPQDVSSDFTSAVDLWSQGRKQESLDAMRRLLASDPSAEDVYEVYLATDADVLTSFMAEGEEFTKVARRFLERASLGRKSIENDEDRIQGLVSTFMNSDDATEQMRTAASIRSAHGEYAAPRFINFLGDSTDPDRVSKAIRGLIGIGPRSVMPLLAALESDNATMRQNAALALGTIGDPRAGATLLAVAQADDVDIVRTAAAGAAERCGASGDAVALLIQQGDDYHHRRANVLRDYDYSDVVWAMGDEGLMSMPVPRSIYNNEVAKNAYYTALRLDAGSMDAQAGIARESVDIQAKLAALESAGQDVADLQEKAQAGMLAVLSAGPAALDRALSWSVAAGDSATGSRIAQQLGDLASEPMASLNAALVGGGASMAGEAAVALAHIAVRTQTAASGDIVGALGTAAGRRVVKVAVVIDGDAQRADALISALDGQDVLGQHAGSGIQGLVMLGQLAGVDAILVGDDLADLTTDAVISQIRQNPAFENTPTFLLTANEDLAEAYGDRIQGAFAGADGIDALSGVFEAKLDDSRARADALAGRAAGALAALASSGRTDVSSAMSGLMQAIDGRSEAVAVPALNALSSIGGASAVEGILGVLSGGDSDAVRVAAADALGAIGSRVSLGDGARSAISELLGSDAGLDVRSAAARALGRMKLDAGARAGVLNAVRVRVGQ
ncbi:MAG: HEAT repeat domain-containing protein, partial [Planctomycetota bacterium]